MSDVLHMIYDEIAAVKSIEQYRIISHSGKQIFKTGNAGKCGIQ